jgi:hypothetical protein
MTDDCAHCLTAKGLCERCHVGVLPLLAINLGWLRMMGETVIEQKRRQSKPSMAAEKAKRREARKLSRRGYAGLLTHLRTAA